MVDHYVALKVPTAPGPSSAAARAVFLANRRRDTKPEIELRRRLFALGLRYLVDATPDGLDRRRRVDVLLRGSRIAVLVHGCFWHCCPQDFAMPKSNSGWWEQKFRAIKHRDADTETKLATAGWLPHVVWEHEDMDRAAVRIADLHCDRITRGRGTPS